MEQIIGKRKREQSQYKTIKIQKLETFQKLSKCKMSAIVNIEYNGTELKQINLIKKEGYYMTIVIFSLERNINFNKEIDFSQSTRNLREHKTYYCKSANELLSQFYCFLIDNNLKHVIAYDHDIDKFLKISNCVYIEDYLKQSYFLRSYSLKNIAFLFLNKISKNGINMCIHTAELVNIL